MKRIAAADRLRDSAKASVFVECSSGSGFFLSILWVVALWRW